MRTNTKEKKRSSTLPLTHYEVLELDERADRAAIEEQAMKLRKFWQCDLVLKWASQQSGFINPIATVQMRLEEAIVILSDAEKKLIYDTNLPTELSKNDAEFRICKKIILKEYKNIMQTHMDGLKRQLSRCRRAIHSSRDSQERRLAMLTVIKSIEDQLEILNPKKLEQFLLNALKDLNRECKQDSSMLDLFCISFTSFCDSKFNPKEIPLKITVLAFILFIYKGHLGFHYPNCKATMMSKDDMREKISVFLINLQLKYLFRKLKIEFPELSINEIWQKVHAECQNAVENLHKLPMGSFKSKYATRNSFNERVSISDFDDHIAYISLEKVIIDLHTIDLIYEQNDVVFNYLEIKLKAPEEFSEYFARPRSSRFPYRIEVGTTNNKFLDLFMTLVEEMERDTYDPKLWPEECHLAFDKTASHVFRCATDESLSCFWKDQRVYHRGHDSMAQLAEPDLRPEREGNPNVALMTEGAYNCHVVLCVDKKEHRCWLLHVSPPIFVGFFVNSEASIKATGRGKEYLDLESPYFDGDTKKANHDELDIFVFSNSVGASYIYRKKLQSISPKITYHEINFDKFDLSYEPRTGALVIRNSNAHNELEYFNINLDMKNMDSAEPASGNCSPRGAF